MIASGRGVVIYGGGWQRGIAQRLQAAVSFSFSSRQSVDFPAPGCAPPGRADSDGDFAMYRTIPFSSARFPVSARLPLMIACAYWSVVYSVRTLLFFPVIFSSTDFLDVRVSLHGPRARAKLGAPKVSCGRMMYSRIKSASGET